MRALNSLSRFTQRVILLWLLAIIAVASLALAFLAGEISDRVHRNAADQELVEQYNPTDAPLTYHDSRAVAAGTIPLRGADDTRYTGITAGMQIYLRGDDGPSSSCSLGPVISPAVATTAGHCGEVGDTVLDPHNDTLIGVVEKSLDAPVDAALIRLANNIHPDDVTVDTLNPVTPAVGEVITKTGATTGTTSGLSRDEPHVRNTVMSARAEMCSLPGDSGGVVRNAAGDAVGVLSYYIGGADSGAGDLSAGDINRQRCRDGELTTGYAPMGKVLGALGYT